ncbi:hypothetical protein E1A91_A09G115600v1 [Gossypium mustelinum]|uniref:PPC domain-containing protein n=1 Tax=Gossypium mustelinum TaxID=34275 RepID=A0A5D2XXA8_GOSMU|nr:hypothetical protein E1A91_A09G115600v1 [Gossypium mustelinum]
MADYREYIPLVEPHTFDHSSDPNPPPSVQTCGGSSEVLQGNTARKPRGRPPGSKNKPKTPTVITRDNDSAMKTAVLQISAGFDVIENIINFARRNHVGVSIISSTGFVSDVILRYSSSQGAPYRFAGAFGILSLSGSFFADHSTTSTPCSSFNIILSGGQTQLLGGIVAGKVMAATPVTVVLLTFASPSFYKLPYEGDDEDHHHQTMPCNIDGTIQCYIPFIPWASS